MAEISATAHEAAPGGVQGQCLVCGSAVAQAMAEIPATAYEAVPDLRMEQEHCLRRGSKTKLAGWIMALRSLA